jgi:hypothetical protein
MAIMATRDDQERRSGGDVHEVAQKEGEVLKQATIQLLNAGC